MSTQALDYREIINPTVQFELYNPSDDDVEFQYDGNPYVIPANHRKAEIIDPRTGRVALYPKPGVLPIIGIPPRPGRWPVEARKIVEFVCGHNGRGGVLGKAGVRPLFQDGRDALVKEEARRGWAENALYNYQERTRAWETEVEQRKAQGLPVPRPGHDVMKAYRKLGEMQAITFEKFSCPVCNWGFLEEIDVNVHVVTHHPTHAYAETARLMLDPQNPGRVGLGSVEVTRAPEKPIPAGITSAGATIAAAGDGVEIPDPGLPTGTPQSLEEIARRASENLGGERANLRQTKSKLPKAGQ
jgi:hypothetical protein